ncbi:unnamed protein product, partial [Effrenium voratum]
HFVQGVEVRPSSLAAIAMGWKSKSALLLPGESQTLLSVDQQKQKQVARCTYRYVDRAGERTAEFPVDPNDDVSGAVSSASSGPLKDYQDKLKAIQLREKGLSKAEIAEKVGRSEYWVKRW